MHSAHRPTREFPAHLEELYRRFPFDRSLAQDPLSCVRPFARTRDSAEVAGIVAATLAIGNVTAIRNAVADVVGRSGGDLGRFVDESSGSESARALRTFRHRWIRGDQVAFLLGRIREIRSTHGSLEAAFLDGFRERAGFAEGLDRLARELRGNGGASSGRGAVPRGYAHLFPSPLEAGHSACKRLTLFVRWMARTGYPDLGFWSGVPTSELRIPLDQHVYWIAYHLGLTRRRSRNWATVEEITAALRAIDPDDPAKYDFVLCHTGISGDCPKERDLSVCGPCVVRPDCLLWRGRPSAG